MKILDILPESLVIPVAAGRTKEEVLRELAEHLAAVHPEIDAGRLVEVLWERERLGQHRHRRRHRHPARQAARPRRPSSAPSAATSQGVDFESLDGNPSKLFFLLVAPEDSVGQHLKALARVSRLLKDPEFRARLLTAPDQAELYRTIREEDEKY